MTPSKLFHGTVSAFRTDADIKVPYSRKQFSRAEENLRKSKQISAFCGLMNILVRIRIFIVHELHYKILE